MIIRTYTLVFNLIFLLLIICPPLCGQNNVIVPLTVGNHWEFVDSTFNNDALLVVDTSKFGITDKQIIEYEGNNYEVYYWTWYNMYTNPPEPQTKKWLVRNEQDGFWQYGLLNDADTLLLQNLFLKFPSSIGDSWPVFAYVTTDTSINVGDTLLMECADNNSEYITPIGTFQCYVYHYDWVFSKTSTASFISQLGFTKSIYNNEYTEADSFKFTSYYATNIGLVGQEYSLGPLKTNSHLISYDLVSDVQAIKNGSMDFQLYQNYPNPFNPSTIISYSLSNASNVTIKVFDILGNEVATLVNEFKPAGNYELEFNASRLTSGLYFYRIISGNYSNTKKMLILK
jgi:hypothetical protein